MSWLGYVACVIVGMVAGAVAGVVLICWLLHCSHKNFTAGVTGSPKGK